MKEQAATIESLLNHADWVRNLAQRLVQDPNLAEDVAQRAWVEAIEQPPRHLGNPRAWLAQVTRNAARQLGRSDARRTRRERDTARRDRVESTLDVVERASRQRELVGSVVALEEPYRTTLLLHFFEGMSVRAVAKRMECPVDTVRTRLRRGLEVLRSKLDQDYGDRSAWCAWAVPLAQQVPLGASSITPWALVAAGLAAGVVAVIAWQGSLGRSPSVATPVAGVTITDSKSEVALADPGNRKVIEGTEAGHGSHDHGESTTLEPAAILPPTEDPVLEKGWVFDERGDPIPNFSLSCGGVETETNDEGYFEVLSPSKLEKFAATEPDWCLAFLRRIGPEKDADYALVAVRSRHVRGIAVDGDGAPVEGLTILAQGIAGLPHFDRDLYGPGNDRVPTVESVTSAEGNFAFPSLPDVDLQKIYCHYRDEYVSVELERGNIEGLVLDLGAPEVEQPWIEGLVLDTSGDPVPDAQVDLCWHSMTTDRDGAYRLSLRDLPRGFHLTAFTKEGTCAVFDGDFNSLPDIGNGNRTLNLVVDEPPGAIRIRLLDASGAPARHFRLRFLSGAPIGSSSTLLESELQARRLPYTDKRGEVVIDHLFDKPYTIRLKHLNDGRLLHVEDLRPGLSGEPALVELRLPDPPYRGSFEGILEDLSGDPIQGASVIPMMVDFDGSDYGHEHYSTSSSGVADAVTTDSEGRFRFDRLPLGPVFLSVNGPSINSGNLDLPEDLDGFHRFELPATCKFRIAEGAVPDGGSVYAVDRKGSRLTIEIKSGSTSFGTSEYRWSANEEPPILRVSQLATTLVVKPRGKPEIRVPVRLRQGATEVIHP